MSLNYIGERRSIQMSAGWGLEGGSGENALHIQPSTKITTPINAKTKELLSCQYFFYWISDNSCQFIILYLIKYIKTSIDLLFLNLNSLWLSKCLKSCYLLRANFLNSVSVENLCGKLHQKRIIACGMSGIEKWQQAVIVRCRAKSRIKTSPWHFLH